MEIYICSEYKCYTTEAEGRRAFEVPFFDGKCAAFIEGYRFIPEGETWTRVDGVEFSGEMIRPWKDVDVLAAYQEQYEAMSGEPVEPSEPSEPVEPSDSSDELLAELDAAYREGVNSV